MEQRVTVSPAIEALVHEAIYALKAGFEQRVALAPATEALVHEGIQALKVIESRFVVPSATEALVQESLHAIKFIGILLAFSLVTLALALGGFSYVLWARDRRQVTAHRDLQNFDGRKRE